MTEVYESILLIKQEVFVYKIPPRATNRGYRANEWNLNSPDWTGRLRLVSRENGCFIKLEDKTSGALFAQCPIDTYPGMAVESVSDSSRYFVLRIQDDNGRNAFIGVGFADRSDSFDLNVALQDFFKGVQKEQAIEKEKDEPKEALNLGFKEGETIKINMKIARKDGESSKAKSKLPGVSPGGTIGFLPPPPAGAIKTSPATTPSQPTASPSKTPAAAASNANANWVQF